MAADHLQGPAGGSGQAPDAYPPHLHLFSDFPVFIHIKKPQTVE
jgi:hypothetical protein